MTSSRSNRKAPPPSESGSTRLPSEVQSRSPWGPAAALVVVGFAAGVIWPHLAGVELAPKPPADALARPKSSATEEAPVDNRPDAPARIQEQQVKLIETIVVHCDDGGKRLESCDTPPFQDVAIGRLANLANCDAAKGSSGKLSIGFDLDFETGKIRKIVHGKSTTLPKKTTQAVLACAEREFETAALSDVAHLHQRYLLFFVAEFTPPGSIDREEQGDDIATASGTATVVFGSVRIHEEPTLESKSKGNLLFGSRITVTGRKDDWYRVKYDAKGREGWVHRNAIGM